eukprot:5122245-Prymnesium_polylepis.2
MVYSLVRPRRWSITSAWCLHGLFLGSCRSDPHLGAMPYAYSRLFPRLTTCPVFPTERREPTQRGHARHVEISHPH